MEYPGRGAQGWAILRLALARDLETPECPRKLTRLQQLEPAAEPFGRDIAVPGQPLRLEQRLVDLRVVDTPPLLTGAYERRS